ncbi:MAG: DUF1214 domain-containing protein [Chlamydiae bacterium]|nr:DUF1214 domain-containing protein [Chlamydiota bacterium]
MQCRIISILLTSSFCLLANSFSKETVVSLPKEATEEWLDSLSLQAATWGAPLVTMYALRDHDAVGPKAKAKPNTIWRMEDISTPELSKESGYVTPNVNVIYGFGFMDLRTDPIILEAPNSSDRYYMIEIVDMWTNAFAYVGGKSTGYGGGKYALVSPGWKGTLPKGIQRIDCPTPWVLLQPRVHIYNKGKIDLAGAKEILSGIKVSTYAEFLGKPSQGSVSYNYPAPNPVHTDASVSDVNYKDPLQFWEILSIAMNENPPPKDQISAILPSLKALGIQLGKPWDRSTLTPIVLASMERAATKISDTLDHLVFGTLYKGAFIPPATIGNPGADYMTRAVVARVGLTANIPYESVYWMYTADAKGAPLSGANTYTMTFKEGIPYFEPGFWSITMYDAENNYTVPNAVKRYMIGSDSSDLKKNTDGSFTIYLQKDSPGTDKESNWLPSPSGPFYLIPRSYAPKPQIIDILSDVNAWMIPAIIPQ